MEGRPWLRITLILVGFVLLGWPVWSVTHSEAVVMPAKADSQHTPESLRVEITFTQPPTTFALEYLGRPLLSGQAPAREFAVDWSVIVPDEGVEIFLGANFPAGSVETATRVRVKDGENVVAEDTFWATENLAETLTIPAPTTSSSR